MNLKLAYQRYCNTPFKRVVFWFAFAFSTCSFILIFTVFLMQDRLIKRFIHDANKKLAVRMHAPHIKVTALTNFPDVSISFHNLVVYESNTVQADTLAHLETLYFTFNVFDLINGQYQLHQLYAENGQIAMRTTAKGIHNFEITKPDKTTTVDPDEHFSFLLNRVRFKNIRFAYDNQRTKQLYDVKIEDITSTLAYQQNTIETGLEGTALIHTIQLEGQDYAENKAFSLNSRITYQLKGNGITIHPSAIQIGKGHFALAGAYNMQAKDDIQLQLDGKNTNFQTLLAFTPHQVRQQLSNYQTTGKAYFSASLSGNLAARQQPKITVNFGCDQVGLIHPDYEKEIRDLSFKGFFTNGKKHQLSSSTIQLDSISGLLENQAFEGAFSLRNFKKPVIQAKLKTSLNIKDVLDFYPVDAIEAASGTIRTDLQISGDLSSKWNYKASGTIGLTDFMLKATDYPHAIQLDSSLVEVKGQRLVIHPMSIAIADSDLKIKGAIKHWSNLMKGEWETIVPQITIQSQQLNLNQLLVATNQKGAANQSNASTTSQTPQFDLNVSVDKLIYDTWEIQNITGSIQSAAPQQLRFKALKMKLFEGQIAIDGLVELDETASMYAGTADFKNVNVKTLFQSFNDFDLTAISYKNLEGLLTAHLAAQLIFDQDWNTKWEFMDAVIVGKIRNGKLLNYEPMQRLAGFMQNKDLANISFSELSDTIFIRNNTMTLPRMAINSSAGQLFVSGTQVIDGEMEYHLQVPLKNFKKPDKDEAFGAIEDDGLGNGNLFLVITGTPDDYKIGYDKKEVVNKIKNDLKKEKKEFSSLFKKKQKEKQVGLKDDYF